MENSCEDLLMKEMNTLKIRIKFASGESTPVPSEPTYQYNWFRIITFTIVMLAIIWLVTHSIVNQDLDTDNSITEQFTTLPAANPPPAKAIDKTNAISPVVENLIEVSQVSNNNSSAEPTQLTVTAVAKNIDNTDNTQLVSNTQEDTQTINAITGLNKMTPLSVADQENKLFTHSTKQILSSQIKRFMLAKTIRNKEPIGTIDDIKFDHNKIATIYAYSDASDLSNETLYYQWSFNGKSVAKVKVKVRGDRWRSYSSKFIPENMHGQWQVALQNQKGDNLAIQSFVY